VRASDVIVYGGTWTFTGNSIVVAAEGISITTIATEPWRGGPETNKLATGTMIVENGAHATFSNASNSFERLVVRSGATAILTQINEIEHDVTLNSGTLEIHRSQSLGTANVSMTDSTLILAGGATNNINVANKIALAGTDNTFSVGSGKTATLSGEITGTSAITKTGGGTLRLTGTLGTETPASSGNYAFDGNIAVTGGTTSILEFHKSHDQTLNGVISGNGAVWQTGSGTLTLTADSSAFTGTFRQTAGTVHLANAAALGGTYNQVAGLLTSGSATGHVATLQTAFFNGTVRPTGTLKVNGTGTFNGATIDLGILTETNQFRQYSNDTAAVITVPLSTNSNNKLAVGQIVFTGNVTKIVDIASALLDDKTTHT
jgi:hypothetical protein